MKALILAAGMGTRIAAQIAGRQKCILPLADGTPLLRYTVSLLLDHGIEVTVVVGYRAEQVERALHGLAVTLFRNPFYRVTSSTASYYFALAGLDPASDYLHIEADTFIDPALLQRIIGQPTAEPILFADLSRRQQADVKIRCRDGYLSQYSKDIAPPFDGEACDIYLVPAAVEGQLAQRIRAEVHQGNYQQGWWSDALIAGWPVRVVDTGGLFWQESDHYHEYQRMLNYTAEHHPRLAPWLSGPIDPA